MLNSSPSPFAFIRTAFVDFLFDCIKNFDFVRKFKLILFFN